jgi:hypothetical protein
MTGAICRCLVPSQRWSLAYRKPFPALFPAEKTRGGRHDACRDRFVLLAGDAHRAQNGRPAVAAEEWEFTAAAVLLRIAKSPASGIDSESAPPILSHRPFWQICASFRWDELLIIT